MFSILVSCRKVDDIIPCSYKRVIRKESSSISTPASILSPPKSEELSKSILFGKLHLYRQYKSHDSQLIENAILRKTHMLLVLNVPKSYEQQLVSNVLLRKEQIEAIYVIRSDNQQTCSHIVVVFKAVVIGEEYFNYLTSQYPYLVLYCKDVVIVEEQQERAQSREYLFLLQQQEDQQNLNGKQQYIQLPTCPECLNRLESDITGLDLEESKLTADSCQSCLTCRITSGCEGLSQKCNECGEQVDNWICLVCSKVGCGRYKNGDAYKHFMSSGHALSVDLATQGVWNYLADCFSHRLSPIRTKRAVMFPDYPKDIPDRSEAALESAFWQYCSVVSEQLERQRLHYEKIKQGESTANNQQQRKLDQSISSLQQQLQERVNCNKKADKKNRKIRKRHDQLTQQLRSIKQQIAEYEAITKGKSEVQLQDQEIERRRKIISELDAEIGEMIGKLTESMG